MKEAGKEDYEVVGTMKGIEFEYMKAQHPFLDREEAAFLLIPSGAPVQEFENHA